MKSDMALSGNPDQPFDVHAFARGFVAELVARDVSSLKPHGVRERRGFANVIRYLDDQISELEERKVDRQLLRQILRVTNELRPSSTGGYEGFEAALRALQLTFANCPNPFYEEIAFAVPKPFAKATVEGMQEIQRKLVVGAAESFINKLGS